MYYKVTYGRVSCQAMEGHSVSGVAAFPNQSTLPMSRSFAFRFFPLAIRSSRLRADFVRTQSFHASVPPNYAELQRQ